jgi:pimeloyl-ACP methyl ester carboxylesterase
MRILFVHGLESGPQGAKYTAMKTFGHHVESVQMPSGKRARKDPAVIASILLVIVVIALLVWQLPGPIFGMIALAVAYLRPGIQQFRALLVRRMTSRCVSVQRGFVAGKSYDLAVGSSFGGAVLLELMRSGDVTCPVLLMAPAQERLAHYARTVFAPFAYSAPLTIVQGAKDDVVPIEDSRNLAKLMSNSKLVILPEDDHMSLQITAEMVVEAAKR